MASIKSTNTNKKEVTANEMVTNQLQDQIKYQEKINNSKQYQTVANWKGEENFYRRWFHD